MLEESYASLQSQTTEAEPQTNGEEAEMASTPSTPTSLSTQETLQTQRSESSPLQTLLDYISKIEANAPTPSPPTTTTPSPPTPSPTPSPTPTPTPVEAEEEELAYVDDYGFNISAEEHEYMIKYEATVLPKQRKRWSKYLEGFADEPGLVLPPSKTLKKLARGGIPPILRGKVWQAMSGSGSRLAANPGMYERILELTRGQNSRHTIQIELDVRRTFPDSIVFTSASELDALRRVLVAYSWLNPRVGYCQSLNFVVALLLLHMDEEQAFWMLVTIVEDLVPNYHTPDMSQFQVDARVMTALIGDKLPKLHEHVAALGIDMTPMVAQWFLCMFINVLPMETTLRVWDSFFCEGIKILFRAGLTLCKMIQREFLADSDFVVGYRILSKRPRTLMFNCDEVAATMYAKSWLKGFPMARITQLRQFYAPIIAKETEESAAQAQARKPIRPNLPFPAATPVVRKPDSSSSFDVAKLGPSSFVDECIDSATTAFSFSDDDDHHDHHHHGSGDGGSGSGDGSGDGDGDGDVDVDGGGGGDEADESHAGHDDDE